ncbi:hypothetical protein [Algivirga pacifica]|uniref:DUF3298 domain-containing protein n=1 Tax=Algivirga pacifica TaxID=1162670 RepID=A0ABP9D080_9BACT
MKNLLIIWLLSGFGLYPVEEPTSGLKKDVVQMGILVEKQFFNKHNSMMNYQMDVSYPLVKYPLTEVEHQVNLGLQNIMALAISDFRSTMKVLGEHKGLSSLTLDYKVNYQQHNILSIRFEKNTFYNGSRNQRKLVFTYNYDLSTRKRVTFGDLFQDEWIARKRVLQFLERNYQGLSFRDEQLFTSFGLNEQGVIFIVDQKKRKQDTPGMVEVLIPWEEIGVDTTLARAIDGRHQ